MNIVLLFKFYGRIFFIIIQNLVMPDYLKYFIIPHSSKKNIYCIACVTSLLIRKNTAVAKHVKERQAIPDTGYLFHCLLPWTPVNARWTPAVLGKFLNMVIKLHTWKLAIQSIFVRRYWAQFGQKYCQFQIN